jgi:hypothetical protein
MRPLLVVLVLVLVVHTSDHARAAPVGNHETASTNGKESVASSGAPMAGSVGRPPRFGRTLSVCTSSGHGLGLSCRGAPKGYSADLDHTCPKDGNNIGAFCGYDVDLWKCAVQFLQATCCP